MFKCLAALLLISSVAFSEDQETRLIQTLATVFEEYEKPTSDEIWPGFTLNQTPSIFHFSNGHLYGFHLQTKDGWETQQLGGKQVWFRSQDPWGVVKVMMHPSFSIDGQQAFIFGLNPKGHATLPIFTFVHERFHLHQFKHFNRDEERTANYLDEWNEENQILVGVENWLLFQFLSHNDNSAERREDLKNFVAVNKTRVKKMAKSSITWEDLQQRMEGLADYVSLKTFVVHPIFEAYQPESMLLHMKDKKHGAEYSILNDTLKDRHYFVGATLGLALDFCGAKWKHEVEKGTPLRIILEKTLQMQTRDFEERFVKLKASPEYAKIKSEVEAALAVERKEKDRLRTAFKGTKGICVTLNNPHQPTSGGGQRHKARYLGDGEVICIRDTSYSSSQDSLWRLKFNAIPYIFEGKKGGRTFKLEPELTINLNGKECQIAELLDQVDPVLFSSLSWKGQHCEFSTELPGRLYAQDGGLVIQFERRFK